MKRISHLAVAFLGIGCLLSTGTALSAPKKKQQAKEEAPPAAAPAAPAPALPPEAVKEAAQLFSTMCSTCHGAGGKGDGAAAAALNPKPRDFTSADWQRSVNDDAIAKVILVGGVGVGKSPVMPPNPQLKGKPQVIAALTALIRNLGK
jgi:mono/diheme cytochrome c family protein